MSIACRHMSSRGRAAPAALLFALALCACGSGASDGVIHCKPGVKRCGGIRAVEQCQNDGRTWKTIELCRNLATCTGETCEQPAPEPVCVPGQRRCSGGGNIEQCGADGLGWATVDRCDPKATCIKGECQGAKVCEAGVKECLGDTTLRQCAADGTSWTVVAHCAGGRSCRDLQCMLMESCSAGERRCAGDVTGVEECATTGHGWVLTATCDPGWTCAAAACVAPPNCDIGSKRCLDVATAQQCAPDGVTWTTTEQCDDTHACFAGACRRLAESEAADGDGANDSFATADAMALGESVVAHLGTSTDVDYFKVHVAEPGVLTARIDFSGGQLWDLMVMVMPEGSEDLALGVADASTWVSDCTDYGVAQWCNGWAQVQVSARPEVGNYAFRLEGYEQDSNHPYQLTVTFAPGPTLEADQPVLDGVDCGDADTWDDACGGPLEGTSGRATVRSFSWYFHDVDWYKLRWPVGFSGWAAIDLDVRNFGNPLSDYAIDLAADLYLDDGSTQIDSGLFVSAGMNQCPETNYLTYVVGGHDYLLRVVNWAYSAELKTQPYSIVVDYGPGGPEDDQPGAVGASDTPGEAHYLGTLSNGSVASVSSYFWQWGDEDWFVVGTPADASNVLEMRVDTAATYDEFGWYDCLNRPNGVAFDLYLFEGVPPVDESGWVDFSSAITWDWAQDVNQKRVLWEAAQPNTDYYLLIRSLGAPDRDRPYVMTAALP
jgi:hypothetical protein